MNEFKCNLSFGDQMKFGKQILIQNGKFLVLRMEMKSNLQIAILAFVFLVKDMVF